MTHRNAARALILTPANELLLLKVRVPGVSESFWVAPGGGLAPGEGAEECLRRELREEVGLDDFELGPLVWRRQHRFSFKGRHICQREEYFVIRVARFVPRMSDPIEGESLQEFRWWPASELFHARERLTPLSLAEIIRTFLVAGPLTALPALESVVDSL